MRGRLLWCCVSFSANDLCFHMYSLRMQILAIGAKTLHILWPCRPGYISTCSGGLKHWPNRRCWNTGRISSHSATNSRASDSMTSSTGLVTWAGSASTPAGPTWTLVALLQCLMFFIHICFWHPFYVAKKNQKHERHCLNFAYRQNSSLQWQLQPTMTSFMTYNRHS